MCRAKQTYQFHCPEGVSLFSFDECGRTPARTFPHTKVSSSKEHLLTMKRPSLAAASLNHNSFKTVLQFFEKEQGDILVLHVSRQAMANTNFHTSRWEDGGKEFRTTSNFQIAGPSGRNAKVESGASFVRL
jgi:hypothetical protein